MHNWVYSSSSALEALLKTDINKHDMFEFQILHTLNAEVFDCVYPVAIQESWYHYSLDWCHHSRCQLNDFCACVLVFCWSLIFFNEAGTLGILLGIIQVL